MTPSHLSPMSFLMVALSRMVSGDLQISTRHPAATRISFHRSPGRSLVTTTRVAALALCTCGQAGLGHCQVWARA